MRADLNKVITFPMKSPGAVLSFGNEFTVLKATVNVDFAA